MGTERDTDGASRRSISSLESIDSHNTDLSQIGRGPEGLPTFSPDNNSSSELKTEHHKLLLHPHSSDSSQLNEHEKPGDRTAATDNQVIQLRSALESAIESGDLEHQNTNSSNKTGRVSIKERRGLFSRIAILPEYGEPRDYPPHIKHIIVFIVAFAAICGPMGTSIMLPAIDDIVEDLNTQVSIVNISVGIYLLALGIVPLWWSAFSETYGRRNIYIISFTLFVGFSTGCALSPNIAALIIFRVLTGGCSASVQAVGAGTIGDLYIQDERGAAMGWYYLGPLMGPFLAPILGGAVAQAWGWRATQWVLVIASGIADLLIIFALPETLRKEDSLANIRKLLAQQVADERLSEDNEEKDDTNPMSRQPSLDLVQSVISHASRRSRNSRSDHLSPEDDNPDILLNEQGVGDSIMPSLSRLTTNRSNYSKRINRETLEHEISKTISQISAPKMTRNQKIKHEMYEHLIRPMHSVVLLTYPPVLLVIVYSAICFALIYFFNMCITYEYSREPYSFNSVIVGLLYIPNSVTYVIASIIGGRWNDHLLRKYAETHNGELRPESRISWNLFTAVLLYPPACLIFGWALDKGVHWVVPLIGTSIFGFASMLVIGATVTYLVDTLPGKGATGVALNNLIRQVLAAIATFVVEPLIRALGTGVLFCILMGIITVASVTLVYLKKRGDSLRQRYDLSKYYDKL